ncbi:uncharacterized protein LOC114286021 [Camellia sinensis]|uniref:uncharacterized protein LOC114286021 n=1 Tax=Camellia sinensis TaxID=4442 RepID=UPI001036594F|nr:uncharacterized protein LOC114286021 [Camellia sinensis]
MEAETERSRASWSSKRRKPLSDSSNLVIPTSTILRKLSSSLSAKPPFPNPNSKPHVSSSATKPDTKSHTSSIGSSNFKENAPNPTNIPQPPASPPLLSITNSGNGSEDAFDPLVVYSRRQTSRKTKDRGTPVALPYTISPLQKTKGNVNADTVPLTYPVLKKSKDKGKAAVVPFTSYLVENMRDGRKEIATPHSLFPLRKTKDNGKAVSMPINFPSLENTKNKRKKIDAPFSCPPLPRTKKIRNEFNQAGDIGISKSCTVPHPKCKKKRCRLMPEQDVSKHNLPQEFIEQQRAYFKEVDEFELPEEEISESELDEAETRNTFQDMK